MRLAILALVQVAALPRLVMRSPERLTLLGRPHDRPVAHATSLPAAYVAVEDRSRSRGAAPSVRGMDRYLIGADQFPVRLQMFPVNSTRIPCSLSWVLGPKGSNPKRLLRLGMALAPRFLGDSVLIRC